MPPSPPKDQARPAGLGGAARRNLVLSEVVCLLAVAAAVVSFTRGSWLGVVWVLLAAVSSNMTWYYLRRARTGRRPAAKDPSGGA